MNKKLTDTLSKSVWVSGFHPDTTIEELEQHIVAHTAIKEVLKFKCTKLIKKDQDITKMSFVSFKIDVSPDDFETLASPDIWPQRIKVREFIRMSPPKPTLGEFLSSSKSNPTTPERNSKVQKTSDLNATSAAATTAKRDEGVIEIMETNDSSVVSKNE